VRIFQDPLHIAPHDTRLVEKSNSVRSRLRRNANYDIYHAGTNLYGYSVVSLATSTTATTSPRREEKAQHEKETPALRRNLAWHQD
jgi:hypothetical protein